MGLTYVDSCVAFGLNVEQSYDPTLLKNDTTVELQISLRGLGTTGNPKQFVDKTWNNGFTNANVSVPSSFTGTNGNLTTE